MIFFQQFQPKLQYLKSLNLFSLGNLPEDLAIPDASSKQKCDRFNRLWEQVVCMHTPSFPMKNTWVSLVFLSSGSACLQHYSTLQNLGLQFTRVIQGRVKQLLKSLDQK